MILNRFDFNSAKGILYIGYHRLTVTTVNEMKNS